MKKTSTLTMFTLILLLSVSVVFASKGDRERFLPTSTKSDAAKASYSKGIDRLVNADREHYIQNMKDAVQADPNFFMAQAHLALAALTNTEEHDIDSKAQIQKALDIPQANLTDAEQIVRKILVKIQEDPKSDLTPLTDELVKSYPKTNEAWGLSRAVAAYIENDDDNAFRYAKGLVDLDPEMGPAHNFLGYAYMDRGEMDKAKKEFEEYLRLSPNEANAHDSMGEFYMKTGDYAKSAEHYNEAVAMGMEMSRANAQKATALANGEDPDKIIEDDNSKNDSH